MYHYVLASSKHAFPSLMRKLILLLLAVTINHASFAQEKSSFRKFLNHVHLNASVGYGYTGYDYHIISNDKTTVIFKEDDQLYIKTQKGTYLLRWFDGKCTKVTSYINSNAAGIKKAEKKIVFKGKGHTFPFTLSAHVDLWRKMRIGLGGAFLMNTLEYLEPEEKHEDLGNYVPTQKTHYCIRPFGILGYKFFESSTVSLLLDTHVGIDFLFSSSDFECIEVFNYLVKSLGLTVEGHVTEYFRVFGRFSAEESHLLNFFGDDEETAKAQERGSLMVQLGFSINCPEIPRCGLPSCGADRKHKHGGTPYRGVSMFTSKDSQGKRLYKQ